MGCNVSWSPLKCISPFFFVLRSATRLLAKLLGVDEFALEGFYKCKLCVGGRAEAEWA